MIARSWRVIDRLWGNNTAIAWLVPVAGLLTLALAFACLAPPRLEANLVAADMSADSGFAYNAVLPRAPVGFVIASDGVGNAVSNLQLRENGQPLGPAHAGHSDIRDNGQGRYSHWRMGLWFSASDSTDPRVNGRSYSVFVRTSLHPFVPAAVVLFDLMVLSAAYRRLVSDTRYRDRAVNIAMAAVLVLAALIAAGVFGRINPDAGAPKDMALVASTLMHAMLGCLILLLQCLAGAGMARLVLGARDATFADVLLLGFALSLPISAVFAVATLAMPGGMVLATMAWLLCCLPLKGWRPGAGELAKLARVGLVILPLAIGFGCWMGLLWHGPTETLAGSPSGDLTYYSTSIVSLSKQLYPYLNLGYEYEPLGLYFNMLFPMLGAAFSGVVPLDPFLFITASGAATFVLALGLTLHLYIQGTGILERGRHARLASLTLALAIIVANRYPYWIVESIPMVHAVPLTIAVVYWARKNDTRARLLAFVLAVVGSALSKVVGAAVLAPYVAAVAVPRFFQMSRRIRIVAVSAVALAAAYAAFVLYRVGASNFGAAPFGPFGFRLIQFHGWPLMTALPFILRDVSAALLVVVVFLMTDWLVAGAIATGFLLFLTYPYVLLFDFVCATVILGLISCDYPERLRKYRVLVLGALLLALPAVLLTDPAGVSSGLFWLVCIGCTVWIVLPRNEPPRWSGRAAAAVLVLLCFGLVAVARGYLILSSSPLPGVLTPQVRQIWLAVRDRTPPDALIFTDQTGLEPTPLGGWNTYAFIGARQIFLSNLYVNPTTRQNRQLAIEVLRENDAILNGLSLPGQLKLRDRYSSYFAVVSRVRTVPAGWDKIFENEQFSLYRMPNG
jgi:hypothetical protein